MTALEQYIEWLDRNYPSLQPDERAFAIQQAEHNLHMQEEL